MSEVMQALRDSDDPLENDLAIVFDYWQENKRYQGLRAGLGYEPRDINRLGSIKVISLRVLNASAGFEQVDPEQSYEAIVLKYPERFSAEVVNAAKERLSLGTSKAQSFRAQDIKILIKTSSIDMFGAIGVPVTPEAWKGKIAEIPVLLKEHSFAEDELSKSFRSFLWLHEQEKDGERGRGLTAIIAFEAMSADRRARILDVEFLEAPLGRDFLTKHPSLVRMHKYTLTHTWPVSDIEVSDLIAASQQKALLFGQYGNSGPDLTAPPNFSAIEDTTALRQVILRRFQAAFRQALLNQRRNCCAITGTTEVEVLEAAHIVPYAAKFADRDKPENGILLRSDIHKLFDAHLVSINPATKKVTFAKAVLSSDYLKFEGKEIEDPISTLCLANHYNAFVAKQNL